MICPEWLSAFKKLLGATGLVVNEDSITELPPALLLYLAPENWSAAASCAAQLNYRHAGFWCEQSAMDFNAYACFEVSGNYLLLKTSINPAAPALASHAPFFPAVIRQERHCRDMFGIEFLETSDNRRWTRHQAWKPRQYPMLADFPVAGDPEKITPLDGTYPFKRINGAGVYEIPVGPVHTGIIEPGHFRFNAVGEEILSLEERLGYTHKGIEKIAVGCSIDELAQLAGRISGDSTVAHSWAACLAVERAWQQPAPGWVEEMRGLMSERERIANHLGDIGAICNDVAFAFAFYQCSRLREDLLRRNQALFGHRLMMNCVLPGDCPVIIKSEERATLIQDHLSLRGELVKLFDLLDDQPSLEDRLLHTGYLSPKTARMLGCTGYTGKASGQAFDVREVSPYAPYDRLSLSVVVMEAGDVMARVQVRMSEIIISLAWMDALLEQLSVPSKSQPLVCTGQPAAGLGIVDGWRGEILSYVSLDNKGRVSRFFPRDPGWYLWPALELAVMGNIVPDFPVCNKSINGSYSAVDL